LIQLTFDNKRAGCGKTFYAHSTMSLISVMQIEAAAYLATNRMTENPDVLQKLPRAEPAKSTLPQPGRPVPSRAYPGALIVVEGTDGSGKVRSSIC